LQGEMRKPSQISKIRYRDEEVKRCHRPGMITARDPRSENVVKKDKQEAKSIEMTKRHLKWQLCFTAGSATAESVGRVYCWKSPFSSESLS
jgi:hypothetical protein